MSGQAAPLDALRTAKPTAAATGPATAARACTVAMEQRPPAAETTAVAQAAAGGTGVTATRTVARAHALIAVATLARATTQIAALTMAAWAAAVCQAAQIAEATVHHSDRLEDRPHGILRITAVGDWRREVGASRVDVDRRDFAGNRVADDPGSHRGRGDPSDRKRSSQRQRHSPSP
jgi:hypothetical protein